MSSLIHKIALGTVQFGTDYGISNSSGQTSLEEVNEIFEVAKREGIEFLDTAHAYGTSETVIGKANGQDFQVVSKFINVQTKKDIKTQFEEGLINLRRDSLYGYLAHRPIDVLNNPDIWKFLLELQSNDKILKIGFSFNSIEEIERILNKGIIPDLIQVPFNILDSRYEPFMKELKEKYGTEIHTRSTFLQGLFFMNPSNLSSFFDPIKPWLKQIQNVELTGRLLQFVANKNFVDKVIVGVNNHLQLQENLNALSQDLQPLEKINFSVPSEILTPSNWPK